MLFLNGDKIEAKTFPDKTSSVRIQPIGYEHQIEWLYDGDHECMLLWYLTNHIRANCGRDVPINLYLPYIPNARMDRVKANDEVFTLKWFADFINAMGFNMVEVLDPHSNVATALLNNVCTLPVENYINAAITIVNEQLGQNVMLCYPDEGSAKRYSDLLGMEYVFCIKHRDWRTGKIERLELTSPEKVRGRNVLIVDDICSRGGTFTFTSKELKAASAKNIYLYVTHCENTIFDGSVLTDSMITRVFTTGSIYRGNHEKVTVLD